MGPGASSHKQSMHSLRGRHLFRRRPLHQEGKWNEKRDNHAQNKERADERKYIRLRIHHLLKLRKRVLARIGGASAGCEWPTAACPP